MPADKLHGSASVIAATERSCGATVCEGVRPGRADATAAKLAPRTPNTGTTGTIKNLQNIGLGRHCWRDVTGRRMMPIPGTVAQASRFASDGAGVFRPFWRIWGSSPLPISSSCANTRTATTSLPTASGRLLLQASRPKSTNPVGRGTVAASARRDASDKVAYQGCYLLRPRRPASGAATTSGNSGHHDSRRPALAEGCGHRTHATCCGPPPSRSRRALKGARRYAGWRTPMRTSSRCIYRTFI